MSYELIPYAALAIGAFAGIACGLNDRRKGSRRTGR